MSEPANGASERSAADVLCVFARVFVCQRLSLSLSISTPVSLLDHPAHLSISFSPLCPKAVFMRFQIDMAKSFMYSLRYSFMFCPLAPASLSPSPPPSPPSAPITPSSPLSFTSLPLTSDAFSVFSSSSSSSLPFF